MSKVTSRPCCCIVAHLETALKRMGRHCQHGVHSTLGNADADQSGPDFFPIPFQSVPIETESATGQTSSSGQLQISSILDLYLPAFIKGL